MTYDRLAARPRQSEIRNPKSEIAVSGRSGQQTRHPYSWLRVAACGLGPAAWGAGLVARVPRLRRVQPCLSRHEARLLDSATAGHPGTRLDLLYSQAPSGRSGAKTRRLNGGGGGISFAPPGRKEEDAEPASRPRVPRRAAARPRRSTRGYSPRPRWGRRRPRPPSRSPVAPLPFTPRSELRIPSSPSEVARRATTLLCEARYAGRSREDGSALFPVPPVPRFQNGCWRLRFWRYLALVSAVLRVLCASAARNAPPRLRFWRFPALFRIGRGRY
jgi:hypothetical protein